MRLRHTHQLSAAERDTLRAFLSDAFDGDFADSDFDHCLGGLHVLADDHAGIVGHASVVQRQLIAGATVLRTGYVEAVAVASRRRREGIGDALMVCVEDVIADAYDLGALSASDDGRPLYLRRGWEPWNGPLGVLTLDGVRPTADEDSILVLRTPTHAGVDTTRRLVCDPRAGSAW
ncbi:GNAT family N-acetyltransferase [Gordonia sp. HY285]|uniref:GNAT family N-acetyltransferase n=1 Tax=Gordonia liuliyuniae TaxID=2911517 RepID=UPI001F3D2162|nr:GNAT family N-acetyltransferase [Gordonia liuliyuniae]MCF8611292.1 GNAT family N-acetyltransferase [Gordonia liuliyuniae]